MKNLNIPEMNPDEFIIIDLQQTLFTWSVVKVQRETRDLLPIGDLNCACSRLVTRLAQKFGGGEFLAIALPPGKTDEPGIDPVQALYVFIHAGAVAIRPIPRDAVRCLFRTGSIEPLLDFLGLLQPPQSEEQGASRGARPKVIYDKAAQIKRHDITWREAMAEADPDFNSLTADEQAEALDRLKSALHQRKRRKVTRKKPIS